MKEDCSKLHKKKRKVVSEACVVEYDKSDFSLACVSSVTSTDEWLCDSACSFHMCFRNEWFFNFTELDGGVVYMADNQPWKIAGICSISLKNRDGSTRVLTDVRYIPKLEKNLNSFGNLGVKRFHYHYAKWDYESCFRSTCGVEKVSGETTCTFIKAAQQWEHQQQYQR